MTNETRFIVKLTEEELAALICAVSAIRLGDVHLCRIKATHSALTELKETRSEWERQGQE